MSRSAPSARSRSSARTCRSFAAAAFAARYRETDAVSLCFFGEGTVNIGAFHEAINLASIWKLPVIFVCENNLYGEYSPIATTTADRPDRRPRRRLRDAQGADRRQRRLARQRDRHRGRHQCSAGRGADPDRGAHLPPQGSLAGRSRRLSPGRGARALARARPADSRGSVRSSRVGWSGDASIESAPTREQTIAEALARAGRSMAAASTRQPARPRLGMSEHHLPEASITRAQRRDGGRCRRLPARRGRRRRRRRVQADRGPVRALRARRVLDTPITEQAIVGAAIGAAARACVRWRRSCSPTSPASASTES